MSTNIDNINLKMEIDRYADFFYSSKEQSGGDLGKLQGTIRPALDRFEVLEEEKQELFKPTLARFNRIYVFIMQVCRLFDKDIHKFSVYSFIPYCPKADEIRSMWIARCCWSIIVWKRTSRAEYNWRAPRRAST